jgi:hypothetical protein
MRYLITILFFPIIFFSCSDSTPVNDIDQILPGEPQQVLNYDSLHEIDNIDSILIDHSNDLELQPLEEVVFLSESCQQFIDDYKQLITNYESILSKINEDDGNINLIIAKSSIEDELQSMLSDPVNFECSNSKCTGSSLFLEEMEAINIRKDALY